MGSRRFIFLWTLSQTQNPGSSTSPGCWLHGDWTEHFLAQASLGWTAPVRLGSKITERAEKVGVKSLGWVR